MNLLRDLIGINSEQEDDKQHQAHQERQTGVLGGGVVLAVWTTMKLHAVYARSSVFFF